MLVRLLDVVDVGDGPQRLRDLPPRLPLVVGGELLLGLVLLQHDLAGVQEGRPLLLQVEGRGALLRRGAMIGVWVHILLVTHVGVGLLVVV